MYNVYSQASLPPPPTTYHKEKNKINDFQWTFFQMFVDKIVKNHDL